MEVRLTHVSLTAEVEIHGPEDDVAKRALPTIAHELSSGLRGLVAAKRAKQTKTVLADVSGVFRPGTMTLVLGQPGSGKSLLLKLLSGRLNASKTVALRGDVAYNGVPQDQFHGRLPQLASYVPQRERHFPTLTVKETISFSQACGRVPHPHLTIEEVEKHAHDEATAARILQQLGLSHCQDTVVGDEMLRGVSGGERKRVTIGDMDIQGRYVACHDEISTGLDSAATFDIVRAFRSIAQAEHKTVVMALLQPAPEVFDLFDTVILLNEGHVMYHGPRELALDYFQGLGFQCQPQRDTADFLMDLGTKQQWQYEKNATSAALPRRASDFADIFQRSQIYHDLMEQVRAPIDPTLQESGTKMLAVPYFYQPFWHNVRLLVKRDLLVAARNTAVLRARLTTIVISSLLHGTLFYQLDPTNVQLLMGIMFSTVLFLALEQSSMLPTFQAAREVFYKQRAANLYRTSAYVVATSIAQLPMATMQVIIFGTVVYWICGFVASAAEFIIFELMLLLTNLAFNAWFFFLAVATPNLHVAEPFNILSLLFFMIFAGFMIARNLIPDYFIWVYWISPMSWCLRSIAINQYRADEFSGCVYKGVDYCAKYGAKSMGEYALSVFRLQPERLWLWLGLIFMAGCYVRFMGLSVYVLEHVRFEEIGEGTPDEDTGSQPNGTDSDEASSDFHLVDSPRSAPEVAVTVQGSRDRHFTPVSLAFKDLWYSVPKPGDSKEELTLLKGISGFAVPGTITALMGSSGAGKTTLMDVIAGRKTGGTIKGQIFLNGHAATGMAIRRCAAYCEQMDVHAEASTFREALTFSAFLRQSSSVPSSHKFDSVEECLDLLDLRPIADCIVRGASVEQMKRLTIGVELAAQPSVLFLDEPTSGLDARAAKLIMDGVRKVADSGRTIVCTIHQPSFEVFQVFDRLLLLKRGGETVYFGDLGHRGRAIVDYFQAVEGVMPLPSEAYNPATWMLEVIGAGVGGPAEGDVAVKQLEPPADFVAVFKASELKVRLDAELDRDGITRPAEGVAALTFNKKRAANNSLQAQMLLQRFFRTYWRTPDYMLTRAFVYLILALIFGLSYLNRDFDTYQGVNAGIALVYTTTIFIGVVAFEAAIPMASDLRASFYRERASETYNSLWYFFGSSVVEIPYVAVVVLIFCAVFFPMAGLTGGLRFVSYWFHLSLHVLLQTYIGELLAILLPDMGSALTVGVVFSAVFFNTMGYNPPASTLPAGYKWLYEIVPTKFAFCIIGTLFFGQCDEPGDLACKPLRGELPPAFAEGTTIKEYVARVFLIKSEDIWFNFWLTLAYIALVRVLTLLAMRFVSHQRK